MKLFSKLFAAKKPAAPSEAVVLGAYQDRSLVISGVAISVADIVRYLQQAEQGESRYWFAFCDEMRARDAFLDAELSRAEAMVAGARVDVLAIPAFYRSRSKGSQSGEAARAAEVAAYVQDALLAPHVRLDRAITGLMAGWWKGLGALQLVVEPAAQGERIVSLEPVPSQRFRWAHDDQTLLVQRGAEWGELTPAAELGASLVVFVPEAYVPSPARRGVLRRIAPFFTIRTKGPNWWARDVEVFGIPPLIGKHPENDTTTKNALVAAFQAFGANSWLAVPSQADIQAITGGARGAGQSPHEAILDWTARQISVEVLGATQTTDVQRGAGSKASADVHNEVVVARAAARGREIAACLREQLVYPLVERRFGRDVALRHTPELAIRVEQTPDIGMWAAAMAQLVTAGFGKSIPRSLVNEMGFAPEPEEGEETLEPPAQPGPPGVVLPQPAPTGEGEGEGEEEEEEDAPPAEKQEAARRQGSSPKSELLALEDWARRQAQGAGEELVSEVRSVIDQAERDGVTLQQLFARVMQMAPVPPEAPELVDLLAAVQLEATMRGFAGR